MNRNVLIAIAAVIVLVGGYYVFMRPAPVTAPATTATTAPATTTTAPAADATATAPAADATATAPAADTTATAPAATAPAADATVTAPAGMAALLTPATWDATVINTMVAASSLDAGTKATLTGLVNGAGTDQTKITEAITAIKAAFKL